MGRAGLTPQALGRLLPTSCQVARCPWLVAAPLCFCLVAWSSCWLSAGHWIWGPLTSRCRSSHIGAQNVKQREGNCEKPFALNNSICCQDCCLTRNLLCEREAEARLASLPVCLLQEGARSQAACPGASLSLPQHPPPLEPLQRAFRSGSLVCTG